MVQLDKRLKEENYSANLLLQVHDELVLEVDPKQIEAVKSLVIKTMETAVQLKVPLVVDTATGHNWMDAK